MRLFSYIILLFSLSLVFFFLGYTSPLSAVLANQGCTQAQIAAAQAAGTSLNCIMDTQSFITALASNITSSTSLNTLLGIAAVGFAISLLTGFTTIYLVPLIMLLVFLNYVVFPISFIADPLLPDFVKIPLFVFFNILTVMAMVSFIRGGN